MATSIKPTTTPTVINTVEDVNASLAAVNASLMGKKASTAGDTMSYGSTTQAYTPQGQSGADWLGVAGEANDGTGGTAGASGNTAVGTGDTSTLGDAGATIAPFDSTTWQASSNFTLYPSGSPDPSDIQQNSMNDCYVDSTLASLAETNPDYITNAIQADPNQAGVYHVTMYDPSGTKVSIAVNTDELVDQDGNVASVTGANGKSNWGLIMEKAFAKYNDVYGTVTEGTGTGMAGIGNEGTADAAMAALTGPNTQTTDLSTLDSSSTEALATSMLDNIKNGVPIVATTGSTGTTLADGDVISDAHVYTISNVYKDANGDYRVQVRNPWGESNTSDGSSTNNADDGYEDMSLSDFTKDFGWVTQGDSQSVQAARNEGTVTNSPNTNGSVVNINTRINLYEAQNVAQNSDPSSYLTGSADNKQFVVGKDSYGNAQIQLFSSPDSDGGKGKFMGGTTLAANTSYKIGNTYVNVDANGTPTQGDSPTQSTVQTWEDQTVSFG